MCFLNIYFTSHLYYLLKWPEKPERGIGQQNEGNDCNAGNQCGKTGNQGRNAVNQGENAGNPGGNTGNQVWNAGNQGGNAENQGRNGGESWWEYGK